MSDNRYPTEILGEDDDNGTMPDNVATLADAVVGHKIVSAERKKVPYTAWSGATPRPAEGFIITLDNGKQVQLFDSGDCCAYTDMDDFFLDPSAVDHVILGVGTTDQYQTWHIYADWGDVLKLQVGWSPGNPFYYGYGFDIRVVDHAV